MSRYSSYFGGSSVTTTVNPVNNVNRLRNYTIEDLNTAIIDNDEKTVIEVLKLGNISINQTISRDPYRNTLLHTAIVMGNVRIIQTLIDMGADMRLKNKKGESGADLLSKSHLGEVVQHLADKATTEVEELKKEVKDKDGKIQSLQESVVKLETSNNKIFKEKQSLEVEVIGLKKRKAELEDAQLALIQASAKKPRN